MLSGKSRKKALPNQLSSVGKKSRLWPFSFQKWAWYLEPEQVPLEEHMKLLTKIGMPALLLGAAFLVTPVMAQNDENAPAPSSDNPAAAAPAQPAQDANSAAAPAQPAQDAAASARPAPDVSAAASPSPSSAGNTQLAMNTTGNASDFSSIPNTERKYSRARRGSDFRSEAETTKELNEKVSSLNGVSASNAQ
jgi:hypothetical protein